MPESAGIAMGIDRLIMLFCNASNIEDVSFVPFLE
jgi:lysyl-tRNA synthetase class II